MNGRFLQGLGVAPGVAVGRVWVVRPQWMPVVAEPIPADRVEAEIEIFRRVREAARGELEELKSRLTEAVGGHYADILAAQQLIVEDPRLVQETEQRVRVGRVSASWALKEVVTELLRRFERVEDPYLRERAGELEDVHRRLQRLLRRPPSRAGERPDGPLIAVARDLGPSDAVALARMGAVGLATDVGGRTSHTAILAQALSVPAVAGLHDASRQVHDGQRIVVDGDAGIVMLDPDDQEVALALGREQERVARERESIEQAERRAVTADGVPIGLRANIEFPSEVDLALRQGAEGIGLYRSEFLFLTVSPNLPSEEQHYETYVEIAERVAPDPAVMRTLDLGGEKYFHEVLDHTESNPVLGLRAVRLCLERPDIFRPQLRGLLRAATRDNLRILLPLVVSVNEIRAVRKLLAAEAEQLKREGREARADVPLGVMIEVPAAAAAADVLARESDFLAIGSNDLIQYALAVDRGNESVSYLYQPLHPGLLRMLRLIVEGARRHDRPVSLCGEMAAEPALAGLLVGLGLRELSVQPRALRPVRTALRQVDSRRAAEGASSALDESTAADVERRLGEAGLLPGPVGTMLEPAATDASADRGEDSA